MNGFNSINKILENTKLIQKPTCQDNNPSFQHLTVKHAKFGKIPPFCEKQKAKFTLANPGQGVL